ncbi:MAG: GAF domain-containing protein [Armatimonadetes bacterium]|nr:GAF domain-containing protein [Anaerolineae bacterium]
MFKTITKRFYNQPLARRLSLIVVTISIITLLGVTYLSLISTTLSLRQAAQNTLNRQNSGIANQLDRQLQRVPLLLRDTIQPKLARTYTPGIEVPALRNAMLEVLSDETDILFQRISVYIPGELIASFIFPNPRDATDILARSIDSTSLPADAWFTTVNDAAQSGWFGPVTDLFSTPSGDIITVVVPFNDPAGRRLGIIWADVSPSTLLQLLRETVANEGGVSTTDDGFSFAVGRDGQITTSYNARRRDPTELTRLSEIALQTEGITDIDGVFQDQQNAFAINSIMTETDWQFITVLPDSALPELPYQTVLQIALISAIGLLALVVVVNRFVYTNVARPAFTLSNTAEKIGGGELTRKIPLELREQGDEIGTMARTLEDMRRNLEALYNTLEQRVVERTHELELARQEAQENAGELRAVYDESLSVVSDYQLQLILQTFVQRILRLLKVDYCGVWLLRSNQEEVRLVAHTYPDDAMTNMVVPLGEGLSGTVTKERRAIMVDQYSSFPQRLNLPNIASIERALCVPMISSGDSIGAVMVGRLAEAAVFNENDQRLLTLFANLVSPAVRNAQLFVQLDDARASADRANQVKTRFLASVTHELRTPLNLIINNLDFMRIGAFGDVNEEQEQRLDQTIRSSEHLLYLINDLLDVSKIEAGEMQLFIQPADIYTVLTDALDTAEMMMDKGNKRAQVTFTSQVEEGLPPIPMDARRVRQVMYNLISNAIKFTLKGDILFTVKREPDLVRFSVRDSGIGIPEDQHDRLFQAFERTDNAKQLAIEGTGLGLPISRYLVEAHGGELNFHSEAGEGSTFWFTLPLQATQASSLTTTQMMRVVSRD